jgi:hypothetical protein
MFLSLDGLRHQFLLIDVGGAHALERAGAALRPPAQQVNCALNHHKRRSTPPCKDVF